MFNIIVTCGKTPKIKCKPRKAGIYNYILVYNLLSFTRRVCRLAKPFVASTERFDKQPNRNKKTNICDSHEISNPCIQIAFTS